MDIFEFHKCLLDRLEESLTVLTWNERTIPASEVHNEWAYYVELQIEPAGWQAIWKIPRVICEELKIRYPTIVYGYTEHVLFKELKAVFVVEAVQDFNVHLPERHEVALIDLWPTRLQENNALNIERTADCIDRLRFFFNNVWMPWDNDIDDLNCWAKKHLETRIRFCYDLRRNAMARALSAHIRTLIAEARYLKQRRDYIELDLSDNDDDDDDDDNNLSDEAANGDVVNSKRRIAKAQVSNLMHLHLRLAKIRNEIELLENPEMRKMYEDVHFSNGKYTKDLKQSTSLCKNLKFEIRNSCYVVALPTSIESQIYMLQNIKKLMNESCTVHMCATLQDALNVCHSSDRIYLSPGKHYIKFLEYLNDNGGLVGISDDPLSSNAQHGVCLTSHDDDSILLVLDGDFVLENLIINCENTRIGLLIKSGHIKLKNCHLIGDGKSSTQQAIVLNGKSQLTMDDCIVENFFTGIILNEDTKSTFNKLQVRNCNVGFDISAINTKISFNDVHINDSDKCGIYADLSIMLTNQTSEFLTFINLTLLLSIKPFTELDWNGNCDFQDCRSNIYITNNSKNVARKTIKRILDDIVTDDEDIVGEKKQDIVMKDDIDID